MADIADVIRAHAVENAASFGKADAKRILGKVLAEMPQLRKDAGKLMRDVEKVVGEVNKLSKAQLGAELKKLGPREKHKAERGGLPELPNVNGPVVMRFAPNPSGFLHIGHARTAIINDEYVKRYNGKFILRIEDTDPERVDASAYKTIKEDLRWLGVFIHETITQSRRLAVYRDFAARLIKQGHAYACSCGQEKFKAFKDAGKDCPCRKNTVQKNVELWNKMLGGDKSLVLNLKTDMKHKNPAMRDFPIMRVELAKHPLTGAEKEVYPLMNFSVTIDDHLLGMTHVLRGKDHIVNTERQMFIYGYLGWKPPEIIHHGLLDIKGIELSKSVIKKAIDDGIYDGWDDPRLGTLRALKRRGIQPEAIRGAMKAIGVGEVDSTFDWTALYAENRRIIEPIANRYFFVPDPVEMWVSGMHAGESRIRVQLHPDHPERGYREIIVKASPKGDAQLFVAKKDADKLKKGDAIRLKNFCNLKITELMPLKASYIESKDLKVPIIQWLPEGAMGCEVLEPDGKSAGFCEPACGALREGEIIQFERFGFCRVGEKRGKDVICYFTHE